jgi:hypothetical protein
MSKLPGKTAYSGRRRPSTRSAGVTSHGTTTGGEWDSVRSEAIALSAGAELEIRFFIPAHTPDQWIAFGGWYCGDKNIKVRLELPFPKYTLTPPCAPDWSKFGSMWQGNGAACECALIFTASANTTISLWEVGCGVVKDPGAHSGNGYIRCDSPSYLKNMHDISPEAHFWLVEGEYQLILRDESTELKSSSDGAEITLKSCNRCGRFLPVNIHNERSTLSFSNHCIANAPCKHSTFGRPRHIKTGETKSFHYGFQLECRFCKKYCVNWLLNKQRTAAQMKEDGTRRRYFEVLIAELFQKSKQLAFKEKTGRELADHIWEKFDRKCFNCDEPLPTPRDMHLDHTRPLALLWPLDETATALCGPCNSSKSDRFPSEFYELPEVLERLSSITGISLIELENPTPNMEVISALLKRLDWFFDVFLTSDAMIKERDGKVAAELVVKALQKTLDRCPGGAPIDLKAEYEKRISK